MRVRVRAPPPYSGMSLPARILSRLFAGGSQTPSDVRASSCAPAAPCAHTHPAGDATEAEGQGGCPDPSAAGEDDGIWCSVNQESLEVDDEYIFHPATRGDLKPSEPAPPAPSAPAPALAPIPIPIPDRSAGHAAADVADVGGGGGALPPKLPAPLPAPQHCGPKRIRQCYSLIFQGGCKQQQH